ncbi:ASCH domain-containing protein [Priestia taiwanensis]|uniref:RNA-binding protein n=1 Tax=Priestia taiwanensis TaxID=1347902 RepID=A0A917EMQ0_9BACI|nr:ASCH domain-containing protein [Priestia taiwanensis]MBM7362627.1 uncharacterized protein YhfF [Priestia taiwanensis]GGE63773.1 RNA-binding protein [Priestia taiwanensis]
MENQSVVQLWEDYKKINTEVPDTYDAWAFGDSKELADKLATWVIEGRKTATASNYTLYELENEPLPHIGLYNIVLDGNGIAVAIIKTVAVEVVPFDEVKEEHAYREGAGDRSLQYWRDAHEAFFRRGMEGLDLEFHHKMPVVCERFELVYGRKADGDSGIHSR